MKVRAIGEIGVVVGYYNNKRVRAGEVFLLNKDKDFSRNWMEKVSDGSETKKKKEGPRSPAPLSAGSKAVHTGNAKEAVGAEVKKPEEKKEENPSGDKDVI